MKQYLKISRKLRRHSVNLRYCVQFLSQQDLNPEGFPVSCELRIVLTSGAHKGKCHESETESGPHCRIYTLVLHWLSVRYNLVSGSFLHRNLLNTYAPHCSPHLYLLVSQHGFSAVRKDSSATHPVDGCDKLTWVSLRAILSPIGCRLDYRGLFTGYITRWQIYCVASLARVGLKRSVSVKLSVWGDKDVQHVGCTSLLTGKMRVEEAEVGISTCMYECRYSNWSGWVVRRCSDIGNAFVGHNRVMLD